MFQINGKEKGVRNMRILVLDCNVRYISPTRTHFPVFLSLLGDVCFFGPGYCSTDVLEAGIKIFVQKHGPFDVAISTEHMALPSMSSKDLDDSVRFYKKAFHFSFNASDLKIFWDDMPSFFELPLFKCASLMQFDVQSITKEHCNHLSNNFDMVVGPNKQFFRPLDETPLAFEEGFNILSDNWYKFVSENKHKVVPLVHFIADGEYEFRSLSNRYYDWSVPGTLYKSRKNALSILNKEHALIGSNRLIRKMAYIASKVGLNPYTSSTGLYLLNKSFSDSISNSRFSYTCGSAFRAVVRKFFEIPALGAVLVCDPCNGFEDLGFINGVNAITCSPEQLVELSRRLKNDLEYAQTIAYAGQKLILEKHTLPVRAKQLREALHSGLKGEYKGAKWKNGDLVLLTSGSDLNDDENISI
jgi:hypothetical protein